jgi:guanine deaminase
MDPQVIRGPLLSPRSNGTVEFYPDGVLAADENGRLTFAGDWAEFAPRFGPDSPPVTAAGGLLLPPLLDCHTHIPQFPIRGQFAEGIAGNPPEGRLLAGLARNVFPEEARSADFAYAAAVAQAFREDTLAHGVVGGAAYMTVHAAAAEAALAVLPDTWAVGLVLMNQNCPAYLRTEEEALARDVARLASEYGRRLIVTDRFAVAVDTPLRRRAAALAAQYGLRMQTHLNEQRAEKEFVETVLYPSYASYTDVYRQDGLLTEGAILAHCIQMTPDEWRMTADAGAVVAHCPTSNTLLGSGTMPLGEVFSYRLPFALCTDVGASPTTSLLAEMAQFLTVHAGQERPATPSEALWHATVAPAQILGLENELGAFAPGKPLSYLIAACDPAGLAGKSADAVIAEDLLEMPPSQEPELFEALTRLAAAGLPHGPALTRVTENVHRTAARLDRKIRRIVQAGKTVWERPKAN